MPEFAIIGVRNMIKALTLGVLFFIMFLVIRAFGKRFNENWHKILKNENFNFNVKHILILFGVVAPIELIALQYLPDKFIEILFVFGGSTVIGAGLWILTLKRSIAILGLVYPLLFYNYWNVYTFNLTGTVLASFGALFLCQWIKPKLILLFVIVVLIFDFTMVFVTEDMMESAIIVMSLELPVMVIVPSVVAIGLGDLSIAAMLYYQYDRLFKTSLGFALGTASLIGIISELGIRTIDSKVGYPATFFIIVAFIIIILISQLWRKLSNATATI